MTTGRSSGTQSRPRTRLKFWGVRGSIPTPGPTTVRYGGNTSCIEVRTEDQIIILDAGTGLRPLGQALIAEFNGVPLKLTLLLTHTHWDHIQGLPYFLPVYRPQNRVRILGYEGARLGLENILTSQMESQFFPISLGDVAANVLIEELKDFDFQIGRVQVRACRANHPGHCVGYRLFGSGGSIAFFPDNELRSSRRNGAARANANREITEFLRGTDALIMDTQYDRGEYRRHLGWGHGCVDDVVAMALDAGVKRLFLFHHDPDHTDAKITAMVVHARKLVAARKGKLRVEAAREGLTVNLP